MEVTVEMLKKEFEALSKNTNALKYQIADLEDQLEVTKSNFDRNQGALIFIQNLVNAIEGENEGEDGSKPTFDVLDEEDEAKLEKELAEAKN